jgi:hypothetical protein
MPTMLSYYHDLWKDMVKRREVNFKFTSQEANFTKEERTTSQGEKLSRKIMYKGSDCSQKRKDNDS